MTSASPLPEGRSASRTATRSGGVAEVHLWWIDPGFVHLPGGWDACHRLLGPEERRRLDGLRVPRVRREYLLARALVRVALSMRGAVSPDGWQFGKGPHGRPELEPASALRFSISHCEGLVLCAVADGREVGVDAEPLSRMGAILDAAPIVFSATERRDLERVSDPAARARDALTLWTLKESYVKARGTGFSVPPSSFGFRLGAHPELVPPEDDPGLPWCSRTLRLGEHVVALTVEGDGGWAFDIRRGDALLDGERRIPLRAPASAPRHLGEHGQT